MTQKWLQMLEDRWVHLSCTKDSIRGKEAIVDFVKDCEELSDKNNEHFKQERNVFWRDSQTVDVCQNVQDLV